MILDALLDHLNGFFGLGQNLLRLGLGRDKGVIVINHVPLPPAPVEVITVRVGSLANRELNFEKSYGDQRRRRNNRRRTPLDTVEVAQQW